MWILKNPKELLEHLKTPTSNHVTSIKSFDFSTLYTTIPHQKLKNRLTIIIRNSFIFKNGNCRYKYSVKTYFVKEHSDSIKSTLKMTSSRCLSFLSTMFSCSLPEKSFSRQSALQWVRIVSLSPSTSFCIHTKRNSYSLCSQRERNS